MHFIESVQRRNLKTNIPEFRQGDRIRVHFRIVEGNKERVQPFEGVCIIRRGGQVNATFTVRKMSSGVGVERTFPLHSPRVESIEVLSRGKVRQGRLYYLRALEGKKARIQTLASSGSSGGSKNKTEEIASADQIPLEEENEEKDS